MAVAERACFVDRPLFAYRWHQQNQNSQESAGGSLKYLVDEYASTLEFDDGVLTRLGLTRQSLGDALVEFDVCAARSGDARAGKSGCGLGGRSSSAGPFILIACGTTAMRGILSTLLRLGPAWRADREVGLRPLS